MTREDIHKLLGGYATGSLSEAERKVLFEAALEDQELYDELAREQALKELLEEPGAKQRLIAGLAPQRPPKPAWRKLWPWLAFAGALALPLIIVNFVMVRPAQKRVEMARARTPELRSELPQDAVSQPAGIQGNRRPEPTNIQPLKKTLREEPQRDARAAAPAVNAPELDAVKELQKDVATKPAQDSVALADKAEAPAPLPAAAPQAQAVTVAPMTAPAPANAFAAGRGGFGGGGGGRAQQAQAGAVSARIATPVTFSFGYSVTPEGALRIQPTADGFLTVTVNTAEAGNGQILRSSQLTRAGSVVEIPIPAGATQATIVYSAQNVAGGTATGSLAGADPPAGTKTDPAPSPNSRLQAVIPLTPRE